MKMLIEGRVTLMIKEREWISNERRTLGRPKMKWKDTGKQEERKNATRYKAS
jgi:hypothetical protein